MKKRNLLFCGLFLLGACNEDSAETPQKETAEELPKIVINEFLASNTACCLDPDADVEEYDDWIELYNGGDEALNIGGYFITDNNDIPQKHFIITGSPEKTTIPAGGYLLLWADGQPAQGPLHLGFKLSATGEHIGFYAPDGRMIDEYTYPAQTTDVSTGRLPNGAGSWSITSTPTPGAANQ